MDQNNDELNNQEQPAPENPTPPPPPSAPAPPPPSAAAPPPPGAMPPPPAPPPSGGSTFGHIASEGSLTNPTKDEKNWAMFAHLSGMVAGFILSFTTIPALGFVGPMIIYLMKKDESPFVGDQAKEALNFNISIGIIMLVLWLLSWTIILIIITLPLMILTGVAGLVFVIIAAIKSSSGELYRYPLCLRLIK